MSIVSLPVIIIENIIAYLASEAHTPLREWKKSLVYLSICRQLRYIGLPIVYKKVYFIDGVNTGSGFNCNINSQYTSTAAGLTNISLVKALDFTRYVRMVDVVIENPQYFYSILIDCQLIFEFGYYNWTSVNELSVSLCYECDNHSEVFHKNEIIKLVSEFKISMPNVCRISMSSMDGQRSFAFFTNNILWSYKSQLTMVALGHSSVGLRIFTNNKLEMSKQNSSLLNTNLALCPINLKFLEIRGTLEEITGNTMSNDSDSNPIVLFPKLYKLLIFINDFDPSEAASKLENNLDLHLATRTYDFPVLKYLELCVDSVVQLEDMLQLGCFKWHQVEKLTIFIRFGNNVISDAAETKLKHQAKNIVKTLKTDMPYIKNIRFICVAAGTTNSPLINLLIQSYSNELTELSVYKSYNIKSSKLNTLNHLVINCSIQSQLDLVKYCFSTLQILKMYDLAINFTWVDLCIDGNEHQLTFKQLDTLQIVYAASDYSDGYLDFDNWDKLKCNKKQLSIYFPKLISLTLRQTTHMSVYNILKPICANNNAKCLEINYSSSALDVKNMSKEIIIQLSNMLECLGNKIVGTLPFIKDLIYKYNITLPFDDRCFSVLNTIYGKQLKAIVSNVNIISSTIDYSSSLEKLDLNVDIEHMRMTPRICTNNLYGFNLNDKSGLFLWSWFNNELNANAIGFGCINSFCVRVWKPNLSDNLPIGVKSFGSSQMTIKLYMPNIDKFTFEMYNKNAIYPPTELYFGAATDINIIGLISVLPSRGSSKSEILGNLEVSVSTAQPHEEQMFYDITNSWFGYREPLGESTLIIENMSFDLSPSKVCWQNIKKLEIGYQIKCTLLMELFRHLPSLYTLVIDNLVDDCMHYLPLPDEPISTSVNSITIDTIESLDNANVVGLTMIILGIVSLKTVKTESINMESSIFVETYKHWYPHIVGIDFS